jgi:hypothetical protein
MTYTYIENAIFLYCVYPTTMVDAYTLQHEGEYSLNGQEEPKIVDDTSTQEKRQKDNTKQLLY